MTQDSSPQEQTVDYSDIINIVHDLQAPLSGVKWTLSMLQNGDAGILTPPQKELVEKAIHGNEHTLRLVRSILAVSRLDAGNAELNKVETPILDVVNDTIDELSLYAKEKGLHIQLKGLDGESPLVYIDADKIRNVFENLVENAIKYTPSKGTIAVSVRTNDDECIISVEDSGAGISKDDAPYIFKKFFRSNDHVKKTERGSGLGLYISKRLVEAHDGRIWFADKKRDLGLQESGTVFAFMLPLNHR